MPLFFKPCFTTRRKKKRKIIQTYHDLVTSFESEITNASQTTLNDNHLEEINEEYASLELHIEGHPESNIKIKVLCSENEADLIPFETSCSDQENLTSISSGEQDANSLSNVRTLLSYSFLSSQSDNAEESCEILNLVSVLSEDNLIVAQSESEQELKMSTSEVSEHFNKTCSTTDFLYENPNLKNLIEADILGIEIITTTKEEMIDENKLQTSNCADFVATDCPSQYAEEQAKFKKIIPLNDVQETNESIIEGHLKDMHSKETLNYVTETEKEKIRKMHNISVFSNCGYGVNTEDKLEDPMQGNNPCMNVNESTCASTEFFFTDAELETFTSLDCGVSETDKTLSIDYHVAENNHDNCAINSRRDMVLHEKENKLESLIELDGNRLIQEAIKEIITEDNFEYVGKSLLIDENTLDTPNTQSNSEKWKELDYFDNRSMEYPACVIVTADNLEYLDCDLLKEDNIQDSSASQFGDNLITSPDCSGDFATSNDNTTTLKEISSRLAAKFAKNVSSTSFDAIINFENNREILTKDIDEHIQEERNDTSNLSHDIPFKQQSVCMHMVSGNTEPIVGDLLKVKIQDEIKSQIEDLAGNIECCGDYVIPVSPNAKGISCRLAARLENNVPQVPPNDSRTNLSEMQLENQSRTDDRIKQLNRFRRSRNLLLSALKFESFTPDSKEPVKLNEFSENMFEEPFTTSSSCTENRFYSTKRDADSLDPYDSSKTRHHEEFIGLLDESKENCTKVLETSEENTLIESQKKSFASECCQILEYGMHSVQNEQRLPSYELLQLESPVRNAIRTQIRKIISEAVAVVENGIFKKIDIFESGKYVTSNCQRISASNQQCELLGNLSLPKANKIYKPSNILCERNTSQSSFQNVSNNLMKDLYIFINDINNSSEQKISNQQANFFKNMKILTLYPEFEKYASSSSFISNSSKAELESHGKVEGHIKEQNHVSLTPFSQLMANKTQTNDLCRSGNQTFNTTSKKLGLIQDKNFEVFKENEQFKNALESGKCEFDIVKSNNANYEIPSSNLEEIENETLVYDCPASRPSERGDVGNSEREVESHLSFKNNAAYGENSVENHLQNQLISSTFPMPGVNLSTFGIEKSTTEILPQIVPDKDQKSNLTIHLNPRSQEMIVKCRGGLELVPNAMVQSTRGTSFETISIVYPSECKEGIISSQDLCDEKKPSGIHNLQDKVNEVQNISDFEQRNFENKRLKNIETFNMRKAEAFQPMKQPSHALPISEVKGFDFKFGWEYQKGISEKFADQLIKSMNSREHAVGDNDFIKLIPTSSSTCKEVPDSNCHTHSKKKTLTPLIINSSHEEKECIFSPKKTLHRTPMRGRYLNANRSPMHLKKHTISTAIRKNNVDEKNLSNNSKIKFLQQSKSKIKKPHEDHIPYFHLEDPTPKTKCFPSIDNQLTAKKGISPEQNKKFDEKFRRFRTEYGKVQGYVLRISLDHHDLYEGWSTFQEDFQSETALESTIPAFLKNQYAVKGRKTGEKLISCKQSTEWLTDAGIVGKSLTAEEANEAFKKISGLKVAINKDDYRRYLESLARLKKLNYNTLHKKLCGSIHSIT